MTDQKTDKETKDKKHKKRSKKTVAQLKEQIQFYFSDANLSKDRFMKQAISSHPEGYVKIETIANFNRLKQLTDDRSLIVKAMKLSSLLEVSADNTGVRRTTPLPQPKNVDAETIYVERLPPYADHEWIKSVFSPYGKVQYISLPRFKHTREIKGFAFVEFVAKDEARAAVESFSKGNRAKKEQENGDAPDHTEQSADHSKPKSRRKRSHSESEVDSANHDAAKPARKRKRTTSESSSSSLEHSQQGEYLKSALANIVETEERDRVETKTKTKKRKKSVRWEEESEEQESTDSKPTTATKVQKSPCAGTKRSRTESQDEQDADKLGTERKRTKNVDSDSNVESAGEEGEGKDKSQNKKRKRKKKDKKEARLPHLRVISKLDWLQLKAEYKELQRQSMQILKAQLVQQSQTNDKETGERVKAPVVKKEVKEEEKPVIEKLPYTPGVLLKFTSQTTDVKKKDVREMFCKLAPVAYLDLQEGDRQGFVRFHTANKCQEVLDKFSSTEIRIESLHGDEERKYWEKINEDRVARYKAKRDKKRGTEKVVKKVEAMQSKRRHQHFDLDGNES